MKAIRTYHTRSKWVWCTVDFVLDEDEEFSEDNAWADLYSIHMRAQVYYRKPASPRDCPDRFHVRAHSNVPREVVFREAMNFLTTLKTMYQL